MDKLIFRKVMPYESHGDWNIRVDEETYRRVNEIATKTGLPLKKVVTAMLDFALQHTEVEECNR